MPDKPVITLTRQQIFHYFDPANPAVVEADPGQTVIFDTWDCWQGAVTREIRTTPEEFRKAMGKSSPGMPMTGPVYVRGARPGDTLMVEILDLEVAEVGWTMASAGEGATGSILTTAENRLVPIKNGVGRFNGRYTLPLNPMIGCIGTTPAVRISTGWPARHGGNLDCKEVKKGATLFLPVDVPGALFGLGDLHAMQGDGEVCGTAVEINGRVTARLNLLRGADLPLPLLLTPEALATINSAPTLDLAARQSIVDMTRLLARLSGESEADIAMLICQVGDVRICQLVDPAMTCRMEVPRRFLEGEMKLNLEKIWDNCRVH